MNVPSSSDGAPRQEQTAQDVPLPGGDFRLFITRLSYQGMLCLGVMENPVTHTRQINLEQAKMMLDDLLMLQERTTGNLDADEAIHMNKVVSDLRHLYEQVLAQGAANSEG